MVVFQKLEGKTTTLKFWNKKLEGKTTTLMFWNQKLEGKTTTPKNCVLTSFLHERSRIFFPVFSLVRFWILLRNGFSFQFLKNYHNLIGKISKPAGPSGPWALKHYQSLGICKIYYSHFIFEVMYHCLLKNH